MFNGRTLMIMMYNVFLREDFFWHSFLQNTFISHCIVLGAALLAHLAAVDKSATRLSNPTAC